MYKDMLRELIGLGLPIAQIANILHLYGANADQVLYFQAPLVYYSSIPTDFPSWLPNACYQERLDVIVLEMESGTIGSCASPAEVLMALIPQVSINNLPPQYHDLYLWLLFSVKMKYQEIPLTEQIKYWASIGRSFNGIQFADVKAEFSFIAQDIRLKCISNSQQRLAQVNSINTDQKYEALEYEAPEAETFCSHLEAADCLLFPPVALVTNTFEHYLQTALQNLKVNPR